MNTTRLLALAVLSLLPFAPARADEPAAYQVKVPEMKCAGCAWAIGEALKKVDHITEVFVDPKTKVAIFSVDTAEGPGEKVVLAAVKAAGYDGSGYAKLAKTFAETKASLAKE